MWKLAKKERQPRGIGGIMCAESSPPTLDAFYTIKGLATGSPKETIMATAASGKVNSPTLEQERIDALSEILAESWWLVGLRGILGIIFGLICLLNPTLAVQVFVILFAAYMLVDGVFAIFSGIKAARNGERWGLLIVEGVVDLAAGAVAVLWPAITLVALVWIIAIWAIVSGALMLGAAFGLNLDHGRWWLALGGIASIIFGILLVIEPLIGAVVLTMWVGAYAIVFGVCLLVLGFQLHSRREEHKRKGPAVAAAKKA
jgi:uncharacterized membrane protein HdeD (DUF308 family)